MNTVILGNLDCSTGIGSNAVLLLSRQFSVHVLQSPLGLQVNVTPASNRILNILKLSFGNQVLWIAAVPDVARLSDHRSVISASLRDLPVRRFPGEPVGIDHSPIGIELPVAKPLDDTELPEPAVILAANIDACPEAGDGIPLADLPAIRGAIVTTGSPSGNRLKTLAALAACLYNGVSHRTVSIQFPVRGQGRRGVATTASARFHSGAKRLSAQGNS